MTRTIKSPQHGIRAQMVLTDKETTNGGKLKPTAALISRSETVSLNYDASIRLLTKVFKQSFHHHLDNFISFLLIYRLWVSDAY